MTEWGWHPTICTHDKNNSHVNNNEAGWGREGLFLYAISHHSFLLPLSASSRQFPEHAKLYVGEFCLHFYCWIVKIPVSTVSAYYKLPSLQILLLI